MTDETMSSSSSSTSSTTRDAKIARAIGSVEELTEAERRFILEIAYCVVVADQDIDDNERAALRLIAQKLAGEHHDVESETAALLARLEAAADREVQSVRLRRLADQLQRPTARVVAYKTALALAHADDHASDGEFEFDLELIDALGLPQAEADRLAAEVAQSIRGAK
jgi:tellurite resistance protein